MGGVGPHSLTVRQSLHEDLTGLSVGPAGIVIAHQVRFTVGVGAFGFVAGVYFNLTSSIGVSRGSDAGLSLPGTGIEKAGGVGFAPKPSTKSVIDPDTTICGGTG